MTSTDPSSRESAVYFSFLNATAERQPGTTLQTSYPFPNSQTGAIDNPACPWPTGPPAAPPFWFTGPGPNAQPLPNSTEQYIVRDPTVGSISHRQRDAFMGLIFTGSFEGSVTQSGSGSSLTEVVFYNSQYCYLADAEFGFFRDVIAQQTYFYWARKANCGVDLYCRSGNQASDPYVNSAGVNVPITDAGSPPITYMAWLDTFQTGTPPVTHYRFHVRVVDASGKKLYDSLAIAGHDSALKALMGASGYVTVGIVRADAGEATIPSNVQLNASEVGLFYCSTGPAGYCTQ